MLGFNMHLLQFHLNSYKNDGMLIKGGYLIGTVRFSCSD